MCMWALTDHPGKARAANHDADSASEWICKDTKPIAVRNSAGKLESNTGMSNTKQDQ